MTGAPAVEIGPFRALEHSFSISCDDHGITDTLGAIFRPLGSGVAGRGETRYVIRRFDDGTYTAHDDDEVLMNANESAVVVEHLVWIINRRAVESWHGTLLHGGVVQDSDGRGVVIVGRSGFGKSTLVTELVRSGFSYLSDELVPIDDDGSVRAHPRSIGLKPGSWSMVDGLSTVDVSRRSAGQRHLDPEVIAASVVPRTGVGMVVVLDRPPGPAAPIGVTELGSAAAVYELAHHAFGIFERGRLDLESIRSIVAQARCITLRGGSPQERARMVVLNVGSST